MQVLLHDLEAMGTVFRFTFAKADQPQVLAQLAAAIEIIREADQAFSTYKKESEVSRINRGEINLAEASDDVRLISDVCRIWELRTEGGFASTDRLGNWDPSGIVKAWAAQSAVRYLEAHGLTNFSLNAGGDILLGSGAQPELQRVGVAKPRPIASIGFQAEQILDLSESSYAAVATSGSAERGNHIWGQAKGILQVSVIGSDLISADVWATALYAKGVALFPELEEQGLQASITFEDGSKITSSGYSRLLVQDSLKIGA
ncbi:MAG: hypothetical protein RL068_752 [Actinomycetota bacterium]|jgi:thiamine biosynthesis lipoprotein